jgi:AAA ATPase domain
MRSTHPRGAWGAFLPSGMTVSHRGLIMLGDLLRQHRRARRPGAAVDAIGDLGPPCSSALGRGVAFGGRRSVPLRPYGDLPAPARGASFEMNSKGVQTSTDGSCRNAGATECDGRDVTCDPRPSGGILRVSSVRIKNFRNLADVEIPLIPGTVIVGENRSGKSNLLHAIRLVLDPNLSHSDRQLRREDFWDGLGVGDGSDPMSAGEEIRIDIDIVEFDDDPKLVTALRDALVETDPMTATLTYRFAPSQPVADKTQPLTYRGAVSDLRKSL